MSTVDVTKCIKNYRTAKFQDRVIPMQRSPAVLGTLQAVIETHGVQAISLKMVSAELQQSDL